MPSGPQMSPAVGKSGPGIVLDQLVEAALRAASPRGAAPSTSSRRLCGGMLVAMPTAMPAEPLTSRFGKRVGSTDGSSVVAVVVRHEVDGLLVDVAQQLLAHRGEPRLGVAVGRRRVAVDAAEVPLPVDQRVAQREVLRHAHHRVVDRRVAVGVVVADHVADDARAHFE